MGVVVVESVDPLGAEGGKLASEGGEVGVVGGHGERTGDIGGDLFADGEAD